MNEATTSTEWWQGVTLPARLETGRLVSQVYAPGDGPALKAAIDENLEHLQAWMPWAMAEPSPLEEIEARVEKFAAMSKLVPIMRYLVREA